MEYNIDFSQITQYDNLEFVAKQVVEGFITGIHKSPMHGFSVEFAEHRHYNVGESTRHIDWKLYAKTDKLFVKCYEEENWEGYGIELHSLKSTSLSIGGKQISELAFELEKAGKAGDEAFIRAHHEEAMELYEKTAQEGLVILESDE